MIDEHQARDRAAFECDEVASGALVNCTKARSFGACSSEAKSSVASSSTRNPADSFES